MSSTETIHLLNQLLAILCRSFPQYLCFARPFIPSGNERVMETLDEMVSGQNALAKRVAQQIVEAGALPDRGKFPLEFSDVHDLEIDFLLLESIGYQKQDIQTLSTCVASVNLSPAAKSLAEESLGMAKGHLESLEELVNSKQEMTKSE